MAKKNDHKLVKITIRIFEGDKEELDEFYPLIGHNRAMREVIHKHIKLLKEKQSQRSTVDESGIDLTDLTPE